jgi:hypothetical protein
MTLTEALTAADNDRGTAHDTRYEEDLAEALATLATAIERVRALHQPEDVQFTGGRVVTLCIHCNTGDPYVTVSMDWPCPTLAALDGTAVT